MQTHACTFAKYCRDYDNNKCQGCRKAVSDRIDSIKNAAVEKLKDLTFISMKHGCVTTVTKDVPKKTIKEDNSMKIKKVHFNNPMTIVIWEDGTKTFVSCQKGDTYSKETGLAVAIAKKALGNKGNFNEVFKKWIPEYGNESVDTKEDRDGKDGAE